MDKKRTGEVPSSQNVDPDIITAAQALSLIVCAMGIPFLGIPGAQVIGAGLVAIGAGLGVYFALGGGLSRDASEGSKKGADGSVKFWGRVAVLGAVVAVVGSILQFGFGFPSRGEVKSKKPHQAAEQPAKPGSQIMENGKQRMQQNHTNPKAQAFSNRYDLFGAKEMARSKQLALRR